MKKYRFSLVFAFLILSINAFTQNGSISEWQSWISDDKNIQISYKNDWRFIRPNDVMIAKFMPSDEYPDGKLTSISLIVSSLKEKAKTLNDIKDFMRGYVSNFEDGKLLSFENIKEGNRDILVTTISLTRASKPTMYKSYVFLYKNKSYNLMLISRKSDFEKNELILKKMHETLITKIK
ncbi:MAG: hypothetical protein HXX09_15930 [Bacteroidetes bacterium]|nr:hypothetical protein [Bacteroidota bacterium]